MRRLSALKLPSVAIIFSSLTLYFGPAEIIIRNVPFHFLPLQHSKFYTCQFSLSHRLSSSKYLCIDVHVDGIFIINSFSYFHRSVYDGKQKSNRFQKYAVTQSCAQQLTADSRSPPKSIGECCFIRSTTPSSLFIFLEDWVAWSSDRFFLSSYHGSSVRGSIQGTVIHQHRSYEISSTRSEFFPDLFHETTLEPPLKWIPLHLLMQNLLEKYCCSTVRETRDSKTILLPVYQLLLKMKRIIVLILSRDLEGFRQTLRSLIYD